MSVESPPFANQNSTYGAEQTRRAIGSLLARGATIGSIAGGLVSATDMQVTAPVSGMSVNVAAGEGWVPGSSSATQSGYYGRVASTSNLSVAASDPTNPRIDRVVAVVADKAYAGVVDSFAVSVVTGTPTAGATLANLSGVGAAPASSLTLAYVLVSANSTNVTNGNISNVAGVVAGFAPDASVAYRNVTSWMGGPTATAAIASGANWMAPTNVATSSNAASVFYIDPAAFAVSPKTTKFRIAAMLATNAVAPGASGIAAALYGVTFAAGASGSPNGWTINTGAGSVGTTVIWTNPVASTQYTGTSTDFTIASAGYYALVAYYTGNAAANSYQDVRGVLQVRNV